MVGDKAVSYCFENGGVVLLLMGNVCPNVAHQCMVMLPFASAKVVAGCIGDAAWVRVLTALRRHIIWQHVDSIYMKSHVQFYLCLCESPHGPTE